MSQTPWEPQQSHNSQQVWGAAMTRHGRRAYKNALASLMFPRQDFQEFVKRIGEIIQRPSVQKFSNVMIFQTFYIYTNIFNKCSKVFSWLFKYPGVSEKRIIGFGAREPEITEMKVLEISHKHLEKLSNPNGPE